jgi:hypothetical protein
VNYGRRNRETPPSGWREQLANAAIRLGVRSMVKTAPSRLRALGREPAGLRRAARRALLQVARPHAEETVRVQATPVFMA